MNRADSVIGAGLAIAFLTMAWGASQLPYWAQFAPGPGFAPLWFALAGAAVSVFVAVRGLRSPVAEGADRGGLKRVLGAVAALIVAMAAVPIVGFFIAISAFLLVVTFGIERLRPVVALASAGATVLLVYVMFALLLRVPFPKGLFGI